jgi:hypothetical protein
MFGGLSFCSMDLSDECVCVYVLWEMEMNSYVISFGTFGFRKTPTHACLQNLQRPRISPKKKIEDVPPLSATFNLVLAYQ